MQSIQRLKSTLFRTTFFSLFRPTFLAVLTLAFVVMPDSCHSANFEGSLEAVTITDSAGENTPPAAVISFTVSGETINLDAVASSDSDGTIVEYRWDFGDGNNGTGATASHTYTTAGQYIVTLTVIDDVGGIALTQENVDTGAVAAPITIAVNFQPASAPVPEGFLVDSGGSFDDSAGYGWAQPPNSSGVRDRNKTAPDQSYDTMIHVDPASGVWEVAVPDGTYQVTIVAGDSHFPEGFQSMQAEGVPIIDNVELTKGAEWAENTGSVDVADGRLTVTFTDSSNPARLCWIKITNQ